jgi:hypothetical protein
LKGADRFAICGLEESRNPTARLSTTGGVSLRVRIRLNPSENVAFVNFESDRGMTAPDDLLRTVDGLKELLRVAWSKLADPLLTPFDRREARNQIRQHSAELRRYLDDRSKARERTIPGTRSRPRSDKTGVATACIIQGGLRLASCERQ